MIGMLFQSYKHLEKGPVERKDWRQNEHFRTVFVQSQDCLKCGVGYEDGYFTRAIIFP